MAKINSSNQIVECVDHWILPLEERQVTRCIVDYAFSIEFLIAEDELVSIRIGSAFSLENKSSREFFDPEQAPTAMGAALALLHKNVQHAIAWKDGRLEISFMDGTLLTVPFNSEFEAWEVSGPKSIKIISLPGGNLAIWR